MKNLLLVVAFFFSITILTAQDWWKDGIKGEGPMVSQEFNLDEFESVSLGINGDLYLTQGSTQSVKVEGQQNILNNIKKEVSGDTWKIKFDKPVKKHEKVKIYITLPTLKAAGVAGSGSIIGKNKFSGLDDLELSISGSGDLVFEAEASTIGLRISGSGDIEVEGKAEELEAKISGSGDIDASALSVETCSVAISGSGDCDVNVKENLEAKISGSGDISYLGRPRIKSRTSGSGSINSKE